VELNARYTFNAPIERVWERLLDPTAIAACLPGCQRFEADGEDRYRVTLSIGVAAITGTFEGTVAVTDKQRERSFRLVVQGRGRPGFATGDAIITLTPGEPDVVVEVAGQVAIGGLLAQVGQRLLASTARIIVDRFFDCLRARIG
jgi:carbon monoxide dehydrogenase subunit G